MIQKIIELVRLFKKLDYYGFLVFLCRSFHACKEIEVSITMQVLGFSSQESSMIFGDDLKKSKGYVYH